MLSTGRKTPTSLVMLPILYLEVCAVISLLEAMPSILPNPETSMKREAIWPGSQEKEKSPEHFDKIDITRTHSSRTVGGVSLKSLTVKGDKLEDQVGESAKLFTLEDGIRFASKIRSQKITSLENGCGRGKNRLATLSDGTKVCCRYRDLQWREVRGEFYSYHLNNILGLFNSPPAVLMKVNYSSPQWELVTDRLKEALWMDHSTVVMTLFVENLTKEAIPQVLRIKNYLISEDDLNELSLLDQERLLQWSDLIVFDFVIGHSDRIFNTLLNLQWYSKMMDQNVHNLWKTTKGGRFLLLDNESGFWMGYKLGWEEQPKFEMQERFLAKLCVFRSSTVNRIKFLIGSAKERLERHISMVDPRSFQMIELLNLKQEQEFESRLKLVEKQVEKCTES